MSHFSQIKTQIRNLATLQSILTHLGITWKPDGAVRGYHGATVTAAVVIPQDNGYDLGFCWNGKEYELVTDMQYWQQPWTVEGFLQRVTQRYAIATVTQASEQQGFNVVQQQPQADGSVRLVLERWHG
ncbi:MAG: DUF1257 domain-containing protein [Oscillatoriales cyanobacterium SM2_2_1]|nr:DUF1257 domain-containing protein [Oscillatoriales cyanobacterium SM2_2_1]